VKLKKAEILWLLMHQNSKVTDPLMTLNVMTQLFDDTQRFERKKKKKNKRIATELQRWGYDSYEGDNTQRAPHQINTYYYYYYYYYIL
jgi:hypothetical protein